MTRRFGVGGSLSMPPTHVCPNVKVAKVATPAPSKNAQQSDITTLTLRLPKM